MSDSSFENCGAVLSLAVVYSTVQALGGSDV